MATCHKVAMGNRKWSTCECQHQVWNLFHIIVYIGIVLINYETLDLQRAVSKQPSVTYHVRDNVIARSKGVTWQQNALASYLSSNPHKHITVTLMPCTSVNLLKWNLLLLQARDLEVNPGPDPPPQESAALEYSCLECEQEVTWEYKAMCCDGCDHWIHIHCRDII